VHIRSDAEPAAADGDAAAAAAEPPPWQRGPLVDLFSPTRLDRLRQLFEEGSAAGRPKAAVAAEPLAPPAPVSDEALQRAVLAQSSREQLALSGAGNVAAAAAAVLGEDVLAQRLATDQAPSPLLDTLDRSTVDRPDWQALLEATAATASTADTSFRDLPVARAVLALSSQQGVRPTPELLQPFRELGYDTVSGKLNSLSRILHVVQQSAADVALAADESTPPGSTEPEAPASALASDGGASGERALAVGEQSVWGMFSEVSSVVGDLSTADLSPHDDTLEPQYPRPAETPAVLPLRESAPVPAGATVEPPTESSKTVVEPPPAAVRDQAPLDETSTQSVRRSPETQYAFYPLCASQIPCLAHLEQPYSVVFISS